MCLQLAAYRINVAKHAAAQRLPAPFAGRRRRRLQLGLQLFSRVAAALNSGQQQLPTGLTLPRARPRPCQVFFARVLRSATEDAVRTMFNQHGRVTDINLFRAFQVRRLRPGGSRRRTDGPAVSILLQVAQSFSGEAAGGREGD